MELTNENYYSSEANREYWSASLVKGMLECPGKAIAEYTGAWEPEDSTALLFGGLVDSIFEGQESFTRFQNDHPQLFNSRTGELKANYKKAYDVVHRATADPVFMEYMDGEKQRIFTGTIDGIKFKSKLDVYLPGKRIVDLKTVRDLDPLYKPGEGKLEPWDFWNWPLQMAIYQELVFQNTGERLPCFLAIITKQDPPDIKIKPISQAKLDAEIEYLRMVLPELEAQWLGVVPPTRCGNCEYCRSTHKLTQDEIYNEIIDVLED